MHDHTPQGILSRALSGRPLKPTHRVTGTNVRGESFDLKHYFCHFDAKDFADEIISKGGQAKVSRIR